MDKDGINLSTAGIEVSDNNDKWIFELNTDGIYQIWNKQYDSRVIGVGKDTQDKDELTQHQRWNIATAPLSSN